MPWKTFLPFVPTVLETYELDVLACSGTAQWRALCQAVAVHAYAFGRYASSFDCGVMLLLGQSCLRALRLAK